MTKSTTPYWNPLHGGNATAWVPVSGPEGMAEHFTLSVDETTGGRDSWPVPQR